MWVKCPTELDSPVLILGFEVEDIAAVCGVMIFTGLFVFESLMWVFMATGAFVVFLKRLKKGRAPGMLIHLLRIPGVLPVREVGYSPVAADFDNEN